MTKFTIKDRSSAPQMPVHAFVVLAFLIGLWCATFLPAQAEPGYLSAAPDIPLASGLVEREQDAFSFDKAEGRILTVILGREDGLSDVKIIQFYADSLPNLGWTVTPDDKTSLAYLRDAELLRIMVLPDHVELTITPIHQDER
jgi:hypothetical protein